jgi:hypothetical protein
MEDRDIRRESTHLSTTALEVGGDRYTIRALLQHGPPKTVRSPTQFAARVVNPALIFASKFLFKQAMQTTARTCVLPQCRAPARECHEAPSSHQQQFPNSSHPPISRCELANH